MSACPRGRLRISPSPKCLVFQRYLLIHMHSIHAIWQALHGSVLLAVEAGNCMVQHGTITGSIYAFQSAAYDCCLISGSVDDFDITPTRQAHLLVPRTYHMVLCGLQYYHNIFGNSFNQPHESVIFISKSDFLRYGLRGTPAIFLGNQKELIIHKLEGA